MKYVIIAAIVFSVLSLSQCYPVFTAGDSAGFLRSAYCRISFFHFVPRKFSLIDYVIHLILWIIVGIGVLRFYVRYLKGRVF